jgi:hypothetical protein
MPTVALGIYLGCDVTWREEKEKKKVGYTDCSPQRPST